MKWANRLHAKISEMDGVKAPTKPTKPSFVSSVGTNSCVYEKNFANIPSYCAYHFRLHNGDGGTLITDAETLEAARAELVARYGDRLAMVARA